MSADEAFAPAIQQVANTAPSINFPEFIAPNINIGVLDLPQINLSPSLLQLNLPQVMIKVPSEDKPADTTAIPQQPNLVSNASPIELPEIKLDLQPGAMPKLNLNLQKPLILNGNSVSQPSTMPNFVMPNLNMAFNIILPAGLQLQNTLPKPQNTQLELPQPSISVDFSAPGSMAILHKNLTNSKKTSSSSAPSQMTFQPGPNLEGLEEYDDEDEDSTIQSKEIQKKISKNDSTNSSSGGANSSGLKHSKSLMPSLSFQRRQTLIYGGESSHQRIQELDQEIKFLRSLNSEQLQENQLLRQFIRINFKSPELLGKIQDQNTKLALDKCFLDKPLVVLTFSSPLVRVKQTDQGIEHLEMDLLDYSKEFQCAISGLRKTGNSILVKQVHGTIERFQHAMTDHPVGLHFSGHGIKNTFAQLGQDNIMMHNQGNCLVFETNEGKAHYVSQDKLKSIVAASSLKFVFIASCHSQFAGEIFHNAGVDHVICVQQNQQILDEAAVIFSQNFYELIFKETLTVCQAFMEAKKMLESNPSPDIQREAINLMIFKKKQDSSGKHECKILGPFPAGSVESVKTSKQIFPYEVAKVEEFVGRQIDMQQIIVCILNNRLTTLKGIPGIGKTTISKSVGAFLSERDVFEDGIIYISMRGKDQTSQFVHQMYLYFTRQTNSASSQEDPNNVYQEPQEKQLTQQFMENSIFSILKDRKVLLIIDNLEDALRTDWDSIREFLKQLFERIPDLKVLSTSRELILDIGEITEKVYELKLLSNNYTIQLLEKKARRLLIPQEIKELLEMKVEKGLEHIVAKPLLGESQHLRKLEDHHLCDLLSGHPMTVSLWAPLLQNSTLSQLYSKMLRMMSSKNFIQNQHELNPVSSLKVSMDASIQYVRQVQPQAVDLFCLLGMFPGGITEQDLNKLWHAKSESQDWFFLAELLKKYSLLVDRIETQSELTQQKPKYQLSGPFMNRYAESLLKPFELRQFQSLIVDFFIKLFKPIYLDICVESKRSHDQQHKMRQVQIDHETNMWSCIYRICIEADDASESTKKLSKKHQSMHRHHMSGYSSVDEYESILCGEMTTDNENEGGADLADDSYLSDGANSILFGQNTKPGQGDLTQRQAIGMFRSATDIECDNEESKVNQKEGEFFVKSGTEELPISRQDTRKILAQMFDPIQLLGDAPAPQDCDSLSVAIEFIENRIRQLDIKTFDLKMEHVQKLRQKDQQGADSIQKQMDALDKEVLQVEARQIELQEKRMSIEEAQPLKKIVRFDSQNNCVVEIKTAGGGTNVKEEGVSSPKEADDSQSDEQVAVKDAQEDCSDVSHQQISQHSQSDQSSSSDSDDESDEELPEVLSSDKIQQIMAQFCEMGFTEDQVLRAYFECSQNEEKVLDYLLNVRAIEEEKSQQPVQQNKFIASGYQGDCQSQNDGFMRGSESSYMQSAGYMANSEQQMSARPHVMQWQQAMMNNPMANRGLFGAEDFEDSENLWTEKQGNDRLSNYNAQGQRIYYVIDKDKRTTIPHAGGGFSEISKKTLPGRSGDSQMHQIPDCQRLEPKFSFGHKEHNRFQVESSDFYQEEDQAIILESMKTNTKSAAAFGGYLPHAQSMNTSTTNEHPKRTFVPVQLPNTLPTLSFQNAEEGKDNGHTLPNFPTLLKFVDDSKSPNASPRPAVQDSQVDKLLKEILSEANREGNKLLPEQSLPFFGGQIPSVEPMPDLVIIELQQTPNPALITPEESKIEPPTKVLTKFPKVIQTQIDATSAKKAIANPLKVMKHFAANLAMPNPKTYSQQKRAPLSTMLEPIQEKVDHLTKDGLLLVIFVSVLTLNKKYPEAQRVIDMTFKSSLPDQLCRANLKKLQALILFLDKKYPQALLCFQQAFSMFSKRGAKNIGVALCLSAESFILFNKASAFEKDESQLFGEACGKFENALQIYRENQHVAGQAFCCKQLGNLSKKLGRPYKSYQAYFDDSIKLRRLKMKLVQEGKWIHRYDGEEVSLFIELIGEAPTEVKRKSLVESQRISRLQPGNSQRLSRVQGGSQSRFGSQDRDKKKPQQTHNDVLSEDEKDEKSLLRKSKIPLAPKGNGAAAKKRVSPVSSSFKQQKQSPSTYSNRSSVYSKQSPKQNKHSPNTHNTRSSVKTVTSSNSNPTNQETSLLKSTKPDQQKQLKKQPVFNNAAKRIQQSEDKQKYLKEEQSKYSIHEVQAVPDSVLSIKMLTYSWAYKIEKSDTNYVRRQDKSLDWVFYDYDQCWQIEQFYQGLVSYTADGDAKWHKLNIKGQRNQQTLRSKYQIMMDPKKRSLNVEMQKTTLVQHAILTGQGRLVCRFADRPCLNRTKIQTQQKQDLVQRLDQLCQSDAGKHQAMKDFISQQAITNQSIKQTWSGYSMNNGRQDSFVINNMEIMQDAIYGSGSDTAGNFHIEGQIFTGKTISSHRHVVFKKEYPTHQMDFEGEFNATFTKIIGLWHFTKDVNTYQEFQIERVCGLEDLTLQKLKLLQGILIVQGTETSDGLEESKDFDGISDISGADFRSQTTAKTSYLMKKAEPATAQSKTLRKPRASIMYQQQTLADNSSSLDLNSSLKSTQSNVSNLSRRSTVVIGSSFNKSSAMAAQTPLKKASNLQLDQSLSKQKKTMR